MSTPVVLGTALAAAACLACGGHDDRSSDPAPNASTAAPAAGPVTMRDPSGAIAFAITTAGASCTATFGGATATYARRGDTLTGPLAVQITPAGTQIKRNGDNVARIWRDPAKPGHTDVVDPQGMALARIDATPAAATIADAAGSRLARIAFEGGRFVATDDHDAAHAYVTGGDAEIAAILAAPLPADVRALAACDRLLSARESP